MEKKPSIWWMLWSELKMWLLSWLIRWQDSSPRRKSRRASRTYDIGTSALLIKRMVNKLMIAFCEEQKRDHDPCVILINQTRFKPGVMFGDPETMPGGEAQKFLSEPPSAVVCAKNIIDKATNMVVFKETQVIGQEGQGARPSSTSFEFKFCVHAHDDLRMGETDSFNMVKSHLQALGMLVKTPKGYTMSRALTVDFPTLTAMQEVVS